MSSDLSTRLTLTNHVGPDIEPLLDDIARLRIEVFRAYPYLYDGTAAYERQYLETFQAAPDALVVSARTADGRVVGASTGLPMNQEQDDAFARPFVEAGIDTDRVFYFGESVLLPEYRGRGIGKEFMQRREAHARSLPGMTLATFCAVQRPTNHPRTPAGYRPLDAFWERCGFAKRPELTTTFDWKEVGQEAETTHTMVYWVKELG